MATKTELELRVKELEWALYEIHKHVAAAREAYEKLGYGGADQLETEAQPYYVVGALNSRHEMIAAVAECAAPNLLLIEA